MEQNQNKNHLECQYQLFLLKEGIRSSQLKLLLLMIRVFSKSVLEVEEVERG